MVEIRFHGLGGQGAVTSAELTALAAIAQGRYAEAFPNLGAERRGVPVTAYVRVSDRPIRTQKKIVSPDIVVVLDSSLLSRTEVTAGLGSDSLVIVNTTKSAAEIRRETGIETRLAVVDASKTALEVAPVSSHGTIMLNTLIIASPILADEEVQSSVQNSFSPIHGNHTSFCDLALEETFTMEDTLMGEMGPICWSELQPGTPMMLSA